jgi:DNA-binding NarL/FixJ family response regulator
LLLIVTSAATSDLAQILDASGADVVLMNMSMKEMNGLEATAYMTQDYPQVRVLILSAHDDEQHVTHALRVGAAGYLLKDAAATELEHAIRAVVRGDTYLSPAVTKHVIADYRRRGSRTPSERR